jgi:hypothetical protein
VPCRFDQLRGHLRLIPLRHLVVLLQHVDELTAAPRAQEYSEERIAVIGAIDHERSHLFIADSVVQLFKLGVAKAKFSHPLCQAFSQDFVIGEFGELVGVHIAGEVVDSGLAVLPLELSAGPMADDVDVPGTEGDATPVTDGEVLAVLLSVVEVGSCAGVEVDETNGGAC